MEEPPKKVPSDQADIDPLERIRLLRQENWEKITVVLLNYATRRFLGLGILVFKGTVRTVSIRGVSIEDLVHQAIEGIWFGTRPWDYKKVPLMTFLENAVSSNISNLFDLGDVKKVNAWPQEDEKEESSEDAMLGRQAHPADDHARYLPGATRTPEALVSDHEAAEHLHDFFLEAAGDDDELIRYLDTLDRGVEKPSDIAKDWGVKPAVIYNIENRLRSRLKRLVQEKKLKDPRE